MIAEERVGMSCVRWNSLNLKIKINSWFSTAWALPLDMLLYIFWVFHFVTTFISLIIKKEKIWLTKKTWNIRYNLMPPCARYDNNLFTDFLNFLCFYKTTKMDQMVWIWVVDCIFVIKKDWWCKINNWRKTN